MLGWTAVTEARLDSSGPSAVPAMHGNSAGDDAWRGDSPSRFDHLGAAWAAEVCIVDAQNPRPADAMQAVDAIRCDFRLGVGLLAALGRRRHGGVAGKRLRSPPRG
jgi:hypothetical protein